MRLAFERSFFRAVAVIGLILAVTACGGGGHEKKVETSVCGEIPDPASFIAQPGVAAGDNHSLALRRDGIVCSWGANANGQLGDGSATNRTVPGRVTGLSGVVGIAAGHTHSLALKSDGTVWAWGSNNSGQLGDGTFADGTAPVQVSGLADAVSVAAGDSFSMALKSDGTVWAWGDNTYGQLGNGLFGAGTEQSFPVQVLIPDNVTVTAIAAGGFHGLAMDSSGALWGWGFNQSGQLGNGTIAFTQPLPSNVVGLADVTAIAAGNAHSMALKSDGTVWAWGNNAHGQLGNGEFGTLALKAVPVPVQDLSNVNAIAGGFSHSLALKSDGSVDVWGWNFYGQIGNGDISITDNPVPLQSSLAGEGVALAGGGTHSLAVEQDGSVWAWGDNQSGQLGDGTLLGPETLPVRVIDLIL
jgi:hypothetical protein